MADEEYSREDIQDHYRGHEIDISIARAQTDIMEEGAKDSPIMTGASADDDTEAVIGPKEEPHPNDPYCTCEDD
jgi:hypothetical protein